MNDMVLHMSTNISLPNISKSKYIFVKYIQKQHRFTTLGLHDITMAANFGINAMRRTAIVTLSTMGFAVGTWAPS